MKLRSSPEENIMYILIPACLCLAALFIHQEYQEHYITAVILKGLASLCFVTLGFLISRRTGGSETILTGLCLGAVADVLLGLRYVFAKKGQLIFLAGILVFLLGHIAYLITVMPLDANAWIPVAAGILITVLLMKWLFTKITAAKVFQIFGIVYIGAIVLVNCAACYNLINSAGMFTALFAAGAFLFLISDIVLILNTFGKERKFSLRITNLMLYYLGQILIVLSLLHINA